jgi:hypothetical protein
MITRTIGETITFQHPFRLSGADDLQPAGRYLVEIDEELIQSLSFPAYRRLSTFIHLGGRPNSNELARVVDIDPTELASVRARDGRAQKIAPTSTHWPAVRAHEERVAQKKSRSEPRNVGWRSTPQS